MKESEVLTQITEYLSTHTDINFVLDQIQPTVVKQVVEINGTINNKSVEIHVIENFSNPEQNRFDIEIVDLQSDVSGPQTVGRGNGGSSVVEAIQVFQWQALPPHFAN